MTTARDIISDAYQKAGVVPLGQPPSAMELVAGLTSLNDMMASWEARDVHTGYSTLSENSDFPLEARHHEAVKYMLAERIQGDNGVPIWPNVAKRAYDGWQLICADFRAPETLRVDDALRFMPSQRFYR